MTYPPAPWGSEAPTVVLGWRQQPYPPRPAKRSTGRWIGITLAAVLLVGGSAGGVWWYKHHQHQAVLAEIRGTVTAFAEASDTADPKTMVALMCQAEAAEFTDNPDYDADAEPITPGTRLPVNIGAIAVEQDSATVEVTRPPLAAVTFQLKRENGGWKMCNPSGEE